MPSPSPSVAGRVKALPLLQSGGVTEHARAVVIGGGVGGASIAYHLTLKGWRDIVLLERAELTSGSTFHSAGLVGQLRSSVALTRLMTWSVECYRRLAAETGRDPGWKETGSLRLACTPDRVLEHRRQEGWAKTFSLRGIKDSPPYFHDGRLPTLEDTVEFFNLILGTKLNQDEKADLVAFMRQL